MRGRGVREDPVEVVADGRVGGVTAARLGEQQVQPGEPRGEPPELGLGATRQVTAESGRVGPGEDGVEGLAGRTRAEEAEPHQQIELPRGEGLLVGTQHAGEPALLSVSESSRGSSSRAAAAGSPSQNAAR